MGTFNNKNYSLSSMFTDIVNHFLSMRHLYQTKLKYPLIKMLTRNLQNIQQDVP